MLIQSRKTPLSAQRFSLGIVLLLLAGNLCVGQSMRAEIPLDGDNPLRHPASVTAAEWPPAPAALPSRSPSDGSTLPSPARDLPSPPPTPSSTGVATDIGQPTQQAAVPSASPVAPPSGQPTDDTKIESQSELSKDKLALRIKEVQGDSNLDEATKTELLKRLKAAEEWLKNAEEARGRTSRNQSDAKSAPDALIAGKAKLSQPATAENDVIPADASLSQVEQRANEAVAASEMAIANLGKIEEEIKRRAERKSEIGRLTAEAKQRLEEAEKLLAKPSPANESEQLAEAWKFELEGRIRALRAQIELYKSESARDDAEAELLPVRRDLAKREKLAAEKRSAFWQKVVIDYRKRETEQQAREARRQVQNAHPALRELAEQNAALAEQRKRLVEDMTKYSQRLKSVNNQIEKLEEQFKKAEERVEKAGHSTTVGLMLRRQREELPSPRECQQRMQDIENAMPRANLALMEIEEAQESLGDVEAVIPEALRNLRGTITASDAALLEQTLRELLTTKVDLLDSLAADYQTFLTELSELELSNNNLSKQIKKSSNYIGEHVLWIRSSKPIWTDDVTNAARGALSLAAPEPWVQIAKHCGLDMLQRPLIALCVIAVVVLIIVFHARLRAKIAHLCAAKTGSLGLRFRPTLEAVALAAIVATEWPLLLAYFGWQMSSGEFSPDLALALGRSLIYAAALLWTSDFVIQLLRSEGIAESHFGWSPFSAQLLKRELRWLTILGVPLAVVVSGCELYQGGEWSDSLGRLAFVGAMLVLANFVHSILRSRENVLREAILHDTKQWFERLRKVSYCLGVGVPCLLATLAVAGYYYSAQQVALRWQGTLAISLALLLLYSIAARWCSLRRRNLAMEQARERQRLAVQSQAESETPTTVSAVEEPQLDLTAIHEQLQYLLRHAVTLAMIVAAWFVWSDFLPALRVLDRVVLWESMVEVVEVQESLDGNPQRIVSEQPVATTLRHALFAGLLVIATFLLGRYLPALLEVTILKRLPFDAGGRHAILVLFKYALAITGIFFACNMLRITWSSVQWLAAGMTVGLGFGLQEIFANFVSGLILLFERPIRVGDVITLGDITGRVTNMRIRATTVTDWDRKELIVPNKDLVTGRLLNWTLTDTTNRIVIPVGIAYRSDPEKARELILKTVTSHPNILTDPPTSVTFEQFADSSLSFVVRGFLASMDNRLTTIHELHIQIHKVLKEAGIEIAFPQRDIHVHGLEVLANANQKGMQKEAA